MTLSLDNAISVYAPMSSIQERENVMALYSVEEIQ